MLTPTYNTTRWIKYTYIAIGGHIYREGLIDTEDAGDLSILSDNRNIGKDRVFERPASVAVLSDDGVYEVCRVDAIYCGRCQDGYRYKYTSDEYSEVTVSTSDGMPDECTREFFNVPSGVPVLEAVFAPTTGMMVRRAPINEVQ